MTRFLHGFTILAGTCALTLIVGCGGSSTPKVTCDGGACGDAKRDTSGTTKYDGPVVTQPDGPVTTQPDGPVVQPDGPVTAQPDGPVTTQPDGPVVTQPDGPVVSPDAGDAADTTPPSDDLVPAKLDVIPAQKFDVKNDTSLGTPDVGFDAPATLLDVAHDIAADVAADVLEDAAEAGDAVEAGQADSI
ncbi:MAG: hypothetical protein WCG85_25435 [Polyangia bacterium]